jgi:hypothetical protein
MWNGSELIRTETETETEPAADLVGILSLRNQP